MSTLIPKIKVIIWAHLEMFCHGVVTKSGRQLCPAAVVHHHCYHGNSELETAICGPAGMDRSHVSARVSGPVNKVNDSKHARGGLVIECGKRSP